MMRVKKDDEVVVITGKDSGKRGKIIDILPKDGKIKIKDVAILTKHFKARKQGQVSSIKKEESYIDISNVMPICSACSKPSRMKSKLLEDGKKVRVCSHCQEVF